jgi:hypothetical protein
VLRDRGDRKIHLRQTFAVTRDHCVHGNESGGTSVDPTGRFVRPAARANSMTR